MTTNEITAVQTTAGDALLIEADETAQVIRFLDDDDEIVAEYSFATFAEVTTALALDVTAGIVIDTETVAGVQQWADLDATGLRMRAAA